MKWRNRNLRGVAEMICGNHELFEYRSSKYITEFFEDCDLEYVHDGASRIPWVADVLVDILGMPSPSSSIPPDAFIKVIQRLLDKAEAQEGDSNQDKALQALNDVLVREGWEAFRDGSDRAQLRHVATNTVAEVSNPHRPLTPAEITKKEQLTEYLNKCSEDELTEEILLPLFRQLGFQRITAAGHKDKALEYGKDVWMKFTLPTMHVIYFGIQVKKGKLDSAGKSTANVSEILNQVTMMLGHEVFDPELNRRALVDHAYIIAGGEITKAARNWLGGKLDATKRSQIIFMDRDDILNLFVTSSLSLPASATPKTNDGWGDLTDDVPF